MNEYIEKLKKACKKHSLRYTTQREKIYLALTKVKTHPDVKGIFDMVKQEISDISMDTIYRNLQTLEELNLIFRVDNHIPMARFDADMNKHAHFICHQCGAVFDLELKEDIEIPLNTEKFGKIENINLQIRGICNECLTKRKIH